MTIHSKRRGRRSLAANLAAMLIASVLAVVAGSPAQAANTAFEVKVDHDNDPKTDMVRAFAGDDRYHTAALLARNFAAAKGGLGAVPEIFLASGETLVDSISAAGLAGQTNAPVLLTRRDSLHGRVADFIEDFGVKYVHVLGGDAAVADSVLDEIKALTSKPNDPERIAGDDRYGTAAAAAGRIATNPSWCGTSAKSAVLINGTAEAMPYGVAIQTMAFRLHLPVLMTKADTLPDATAEFIRSADIDHVQIIGDAAVVSDAVQSAVGSLGVATVDRVPGGSAAEVSVELAKLARNGCGEALGSVSSDRFALVRGNPDGVVAAPVLASSLAGGDLVPPLIVDDTLPAAVRDYLAATPKTLGDGDKLNLGVVAVGGTKAVTQTVMDAALDAATPTDEITVAIAAHEDTNSDGAENADDPIRPQKYVATGNNPTPKFALYFSDDVSSDDTKFADKLQDMIEVNGVPAVVSSAVANADEACDKRRVDVTLGQPLSDGDTISVVKSSHTLGTDEDKRLVVPASATVVAAPADTENPAFTIVGIADGDANDSKNYQGIDDTTTDYSVDEFLVTFTDTGGFKAGTTTALEAKDFEFTSSADAQTVGSIAGVVNATVEAAPRNKSFVVTVRINRALTKDDKLRVKAGVIADEAGNKNVSPQATAVTTDLASPKVSSVTMSSLDHHEQNRWQVPTTLVDGAKAGSDNKGSVIWIDAKADGDAAGAAGNDWVMEFSKASTYDVKKPLSIDVRTDAKGKRVTVRFGNGPAADTLGETLGDLLKALNGNDAFAERCTAGFADCKTGDPKKKVALVDAVSTETAPSADRGRTQFAIRVGFDKYVRIIDNGGSDPDDHDELLKDVLAAVVGRTGATNDDNGIRADATGSGTIDGTTGVVTAGTASGGLSLDSSSPSRSEPVDGPTKSVIYYADTAVAKNLPKSGSTGVGDLVTTEAGISMRDACADLGLPAITAVARIADGYAADAPRETGGTGVDGPGGVCDRVDEGLNGASKVTITPDPDLKTHQ